MNDDWVLRETFRVRAFDSDAAARLAVPAMFGLLEEAAGLSAASRAFSVEDLIGDGLSWVVARLRVRFTGWPNWRDDVTVETWPSGADALRAFREWIVRDAAGSPIGRASSVWMVIDLATRRPVKIPERMHRLGIPLGAREVPEIADALPRPVSPGPPVEIPVRYADLDLNRHANNASYVAWALESVPLEVREACVPTRIDVDYRAEAVLGDVLQVEVEMETAPEGAAFRHRIVHAKDGRELAVLASAWRR